VEQSRGQDPEAKYLLATVYHETGRPADAEQLLADVLAAAPDSQPALLLQGIVKLELGKVDEAAPLLQRVIARVPTSLWARLGLAVVQRGRGQLDQSRTDLEAILKEQPDWALARLQLGQTLWLEGEQEAALRAFDQAEKTSPNADVTRLRVAQFLLSRGDPDRAIARAQASLGTPAAPQARGFLAQVYLAKSQPDLAQRELEAAATEWPQEPLWALQLGRLLLSRGHAREALGQFERAAKLAPGTPEPQAGEPQAYVALKQAPDAVKAAEAAVRAHKESADSFVFLAGIHERLGPSADNDAAAIAAYHQAIARDAGHAIALNNLAYLLSKDPARLDEAVALAERAYHAAPRSAAVADTLGWLLYQKGALERAETLLGQAGGGAPDNPEIRYHLGLVYAKRGKTEDARREIEQALQAPNFAGADEARRTLESIR
jgi:tetratricopeptide (TPR) repeat protein